VSWNYRIIRRKIKGLTCEEDTYGIHEVYYGPGCCKEVEALEAELERMRAAFDKEVVDYDDIPEKPKTCEDCSQFATCTRQQKVVPRKCVDCGVLLEPDEQGYCGDCGAVICYSRDDCVILGTLCFACVQRREKRQADMNKPPSEPYWPGGGLSIDDADFSGL
jgi:hypothetical protein